MGKIFGQHHFQDNVFLELFKKTVPDFTKFLQVPDNGQVKEGTPAGGGGGNWVEITYGAMSDLMDQGQLVPGTWYLMTDFHTNHMIKEITNEGVFNTTEEQTGPVTPLLLLAIGTSQVLNNYVFDITNGHRVIYSFFPTAPNLQPGNSPRGWIVRRYDDYHHVSMPMDYLYVKWKIGSEYYSSLPENSTYWNIWVGNSQYDLAEPVIFLGGANNVVINQPQQSVLCQSMRNVQVNFCSMRNANCRLQSVSHANIGIGYNDVVDRGVENYFDILNVTGNNDGCYITGDDQAAVIRLNDCLLWGGPSQETKGIQVDLTQPNAVITI